MHTPSLSSFRFACTLAAFSAALLPAQTELLRVPAPAGTTSFGFEVATLGDVDGDGRDDFAAASDSDSAVPFNGSSIRVYSGATGQMLYLVAIEPGVPLAILGAGHVLDATGDVNGDGVGDFIHGAPLTAPAGVRGGAAFVRSGTDGSVLRVFSAAGDPRLASIGWSVSGYADVTGDGLPEVLIGAPSSVFNGQAVGAVVVYSPATDSVVRTIFSGQEGDFGDQVADAGDLDLDGVSDVAVTWDPRQGDRRATVLSGRSGAVIQEVESRQGWRMQGIGDFNGDGVPDTCLPIFRSNPILDGQNGREIGRLPIGSGVALMFEVGDQDGGGREDFLISDRVTQRGSFALYSAETGSVLLRVVGSSSNSSGYARDIDRIGDQNGDGRDDFLVSGFSGRSGLTSGYVAIHSYDGGATVPGIALPIADECRGTTSFLLSHTVTPAPTLGSTISFILSNSPASASIALLLGPPAVLDLTAFGATDCMLRVRPGSDSIAAGTDSRGRFQLSGVTIPNQPTLEGAVLNSQFLILSPGANPAGVTLSETYQLQLGR